MGAGLGWPALPSTGGFNAMSGPIVRKYGFPNFEKIFGQRPLEHGADEGSQPTGKPQAPVTKAKAKQEKKASPATSKKKSK
jgi:hypothetical protein